MNYLFAVTFNLAMVFLCASMLTFSIRKSRPTAWVGWWIAMTFGEMCLLAKAIWLLA